MEEAFLAEHLFVIIPTRKPQRERVRARGREQSEKLAPNTQTFVHMDLSDRRIIHLTHAASVPMLDCDLAL